MLSKENVAIGQLFSLLEARYAIRVLWALRDGRAQTFRLLQDSVGGITPFWIDRIVLIRPHMPAAHSRPPSK